MCVVLEQYISSLLIWEQESTFILVNSKGETASVLKGLRGAIG